MSFNAEPPVKSQPASAQATQMPSLSLSSPTMKLDLVAHFPPQTLKIQELISVPGLFSDSGSTLSAWVAFSDSLCEEEPVSFEAQEEVEPWLSRSTPLQTSENIFAFWKLRTSQVLVCTGYGETERAAPSANAGSVRVFLVTGKLAKSTFSARLLMRWFALKLLTTLRVKGGYAILLREGCASRFPRLGVVVAYERLGFQFNYRGRIWAFVDSNRSLVEPAPLSRHANPFLVARPVSPQPKRFGWVKNVNIETCRPFIAPPHSAYFYDLLQSTPVTTARLLRPDNPVHLFPISGRFGRTSYVHHTNFPTVDSSCGRYPL